jgi:hypothetical protein
MTAKTSNPHRLTWVLAIPLLFAGFQAQSEQTTPASDSSEDVSWLYVVNATGGSFDGKTITLRDVPPALMFSDRPNRIYGHMTLSELLPMVKEGPDSFVVNPPNAVLSTFREGELPTEATVTMFDAGIDGGNLTFTVNVLDGSIPATFGPASLFVDSHHHHHVAGAVIVGAAIANNNEPETVVVREPTYVYTVDPAPVAQAAPSPVSAEARLADAKRLYEQGLITEAEYGRKREEILATM